MPIQIMGLCQHTRVDVAHLVSVERHSVIALNKLSIASVDVGGNPKGGEK